MSLESDAVFSENPKLPHQQAVIDLIDEIEGRSIYNRIKDYSQPAVLSVCYSFIAALQLLPPNPNFPIVIISLGLIALIFSVASAIESRQRRHLKLILAILKNQHEASK